MIYVNMETFELISSDEVIDVLRSGTDVQCRSDWETIEEVESIVEKIGSYDYMVIDCGQNVYPRFDIIQKPKVGDEVSYCFNGDSTPNGVITKISKSMKVITTSENDKYYRRNNSGSWVRNGVWTLVHGHERKRNKEF